MVKICVQANVTVIDGSAELCIIAVVYGLAIHLQTQDHVMAFTRSSFIADNIINREY